MKLGILKSIAHNLADSVACGLGFMIGLYEMRIFEEARASPEGYIEVDFLTGAVTGGPSPSLARALQLYADEALPELCRRHGGSPSDFRRLVVRFSGPPSGVRFVVTVEDQRGKSSIDEYEGFAGRRIKVLDHLGRIRPKVGTTDS